MPRQPSNRRRRRQHAWWTRMEAGGPKWPMGVLQVIGSRGSETGLIWQSCSGFLRQGKGGPQQQQQRLSGSAGRRHIRVGRA